MFRAYNRVQLHECPQGEKVCNCNKIKFSFKKALKEDIEFV